MPREKYRPSEIADALRMAYGNKIGAAKIIGCSPMTVARYIERYPEICGQAQAQGSDLLVDLAEEELARQIKGGNLRAIRLVLTSKGSGRGWVPAKEVHTTITPATVFSDAADEATLLQLVDATDPSRAAG